MFATSWGNSVSGEAEVVDGNFNTFSVELSDKNDAPAINYVVAAADSGEAGQYQWVAGFFPDDRILSRSPEPDVKSREEAEGALEEAGVDLADLSDTAQPPQAYQATDHN